VGNLPQDKIIKSLAFDRTIRLYGILATNTVSEVQKRLDASPAVTIALGRLAMGSLLIGALDSSGAKIYTKINGGGPIGNMHADADAYGNVRAYATNPVVATATDVIDDATIEKIVGKNGFLYIIKDLGLRERFTSQTQLVRGDINTDITQYFLESQQTPTLMHVDVLLTAEDVVVAGGFVAQTLPGVSEKAIAQLQDNMKKIPSFTTFLAEHSIEALLEILTDGTAESLETLPVQFHCNCSKDRFLDAFATLPRGEVEEMLHVAQDEEVTCQYCGETYYITNEDLQEILDKKDK